MPTALIVAHGQPSDPEPAETSLAAFAEEVDALAPEVSVRSATLAAPGALERCLDAMPSDGVIYPLFMAKGWFVTSALPKRVGTRQVTILDPLGVDPNLPDLTAAALGDVVLEYGWRIDQTDLVLAAHGSGRSMNPAMVTQDFAARISQLIAFKSVRVGFVEQSPSISEAATGLSATSLCLPFFACTGGHVREDIPSELARAGFTGVTLPVLGGLDPVKKQIAARLSTHFR